MADKVNLPLCGSAVLLVQRHQLRPPLRIITMLALTALMGLLQACSTIKIAYNQFPELGYWYLNNYLDFTASQSTLVRTEFKKTQVWHRQTQLPVYSEELRVLQQKMDSDFTPATACSALATARNQLAALAKQAEPSMLALAVSIDASQSRYLSARFDKSNTEYKNDWLEGSVQKRRAKRLKDAVSRAEKLYGSVTEQQSAWLGQRIDASAFDPAVNYAERVRRQQDLLQTLQTVQANPAVVQSAMQGFSERALESPNAAYRSYIAGLTQEQCQTLSGLHALMAPGQRAKALQVLQSYEQDFRTLAGQ